VLVYHLDSHLVPGGYIGVDVFFVISGYLISRMLLRAVQRTGRVRFVDFYGRRARRLMPTAAVVLALTWLASRVILPASQLPATASQVRASALYYENWVLAHDAVSYLSASQPATPVQHFWSLSVEEQFYLIWPIFFFAAGLAAAAVVARAVQRYGADTDITHAYASRRMMLGFAVTIMLISFGWSVHQTASDPAAAYFVTTTRMWELAAGGALAMIGRPVARRLARVGILAWIGLVMVVISAFTFSDSSRFPGSVALLPVIGALLVVSSGSAFAKVGPSRLTSLPALVFVGDISYALYLWHWPVIVLWKSWTGYSINVLSGPLLAALAILLAWLTTRYVEEPVRLAGWFAAHRWRSVATVSAVVVPVGLASVFIADEPPRFGGHLTAAYPGAAVLAGDASAPAAAPPLPPPATASKDLQITANGRCALTESAAAPKACVFGDTTHPVETVALVGDSFAGQWSTALAAVAQHEHWRLVSVLKNGCPWTTTLIQQPTQTVPFAACRQWGAATLTDLLTRIRPDVVITSDWPGDGNAAGATPGLPSDTAIARGMTTYWKTLIQRGIKVVAIREGPTMSQLIPYCLSGHDATIAGCSTPRSRAVPSTNPMPLAVRLMGSAVPLVDMNPLVCGLTTCEPVVGNVVVYRDSHHLTNTYSKTLEPYLERRLLDTKAFAHSG
jgi:peptidoglycan/LPS O-acetylase OafA/YrhL